MDQDLLGCGVDGLAVGSFDELAGLEAGSGADEGDEVGCVHGAQPERAPHHRLCEVRAHGECGASTRAHRSPPSLNDDGRGASQCQGHLLALLDVVTAGPGAARSSFFPAWTC